MMWGLLAEIDRTFWLPRRASSTAHYTDSLFNFIFWIAAFFFTLIVVLMVVFVFKYLRRAGRRAEKTATHSLWLEITWSAIPLIIVIVIFYMGFKGFVVLATPPDDAYKVTARAQKWSWEFEYPNGISDSELHVPADRDVVLTLESMDVIHSFYVPAFRIKKDAVPGRYNKVWFRATEPGEYTIFCAEYCGTGHSDMLATCVVHPPGEFEVWLANADPLKKMTPEQYAEYVKDPKAFIAANPDFQNLTTPVDTGRKLYGKKGCAQCHSVDGSAGTGPTFQGLFGKTHPMQEGPDVTVDENYIRESILEPNAKIVKGYQAVMPTYQGRLSDREISAIIAYIESLAGDGSK